MEEVIIKNNETEMKIYVNGQPDLSKMPPQELELLAGHLDKVLKEHLNNYSKRKKRTKKE